MESEDLIVDRRGKVARVAINRPERMNSLRMTVTDRAILNILQELQQDDSIRIVLLTRDRRKGVLLGLGHAGDR